MECPKCKSEMEFGMLSEIRVDRCPQCMGIWFNGTGHGVFFDAGEYKDYKEKTVADFFKGIF